MAFLQLILDLAGPKTAISKEDLLDEAGVAPQRQLLETVSLEAVCQHAHRGRASFLTFQRDAGVSRLVDRQAIANALGRAVRQGRLSCAAAGIESVGAPSAAAGSRPQETSPDAQVLPSTDAVMDCIAAGELGQALQLALVSKGLLSLSGFSGSASGGRACRVAPPFNSFNLEFRFKQETFS